MIASLFSILSILFLTSCEQFGNIPSGEYKLSLVKSKNYDLNQDKFVNEEIGVIEKMKEEGSFWKKPLKNLKNNWFFSSNETNPKTFLPEKKNLINEDFKKSLNNIKFVWLGHSSLMISINNKIILTDPVFSPSASPFSWFIKRYQKPVYALDELPHVDYILISHDHYDHLDINTIKYFIDKNTKFIAPLGISSHLLKWGVPNNNIIELDWWDKIIIEDLHFICTPAQHFSGRKGFIDSQKTLWSSWVIRSNKKSIFFSGDSGYSDHYQNIGKKFGPFDIVFMDSGQYNERWRAAHNMPNEVIKGFEDLKGKYLMPIGWGMFTLAMHDWYDPPVEIERRAKNKNIDLLIPMIGESVDLKSKPKLYNWWKKLIH